MNNLDNRLIITTRMPINLDIDGPDYDEDDEEEDEELDFDDEYLEDTFNDLLEFKHHDNDKRMP